LNSLVELSLFVYGFAVAICLLPLSALRDAMLDPHSVVPQWGKALGWIIWLLLAAAAFTVLFYPLNWVASLTGTSYLEAVVLLLGLVTGGSVAYVLNPGCKRVFAAAIGSKSAETSETP
jgi:Mn2+/Fe2+ NRAMP family transporter